MSEDIKEIKKRVTEEWLTSVPQLPRWRGFTIRAHTVKGKNLIKLDIVYLTLSQYIANMDEHGL